MPELPEVETTRRGIKPFVQSQTIKHIIVRNGKLRWPIPADINEKLKNQRVDSIKRRAKYLLFKTPKQTLILHLGMSGRLRILTSNIPPLKHDHLDIIFSNKIILRFTDPRRFGACLLTEQDPNLHRLLKNLGPEPLAKNFSSKYLCEQAQNKSVAVKSFIMDSKIVVGVGNIYATEALFLAGIHPAAAAKTLSPKQYEKLVTHIKLVLRQAIKKGGTTLKDFTNSNGKPGYFVNHLHAYGRAGLPCTRCHKPLSMLRIGQRSSVFCEKCQRLK